MLLELSQIRTAATETSPKLKDKVFIKDDAWWAANLARVTARFKEWQLAG